MNNGYTLEAYWSGGIKKWRKVPKPEIDREKQREQIDALKKELESRKPEIHETELNLSELEIALINFEQDYVESINNPGNKSRGVMADLMNTIVSLDTKTNPYVYSKRIRAVHNIELNTTTIGIFLLGLIKAGCGVPLEEREKAIEIMKELDPKLKSINDTWKIVDLDKVKVALVEGKMKPRLFIKMRKKVI